MTRCLFPCVTHGLVMGQDLLCTAQPFHFLIPCHLSEPAGLQKAGGKGGSAVTGQRCKGHLAGFSLSKQRRNLCQMAGVKEWETFLLFSHHAAHQAETVRNALGQRTDLRLLFFRIQILFFYIQENIPSNSTKNPGLKNRYPPNIIKMIISPSGARPAPVAQLQLPSICQTTVLSHFVNPY